MPARLAHATGTIYGLINATTDWCAIALDLGDAVDGENSSLFLEAFAQTGEGDKLPDEVTVEPTAWHALAEDMLPRIRA